MKKAISGSTGFVRKVLIHKAIDSGYQVETLARNPETLEHILHHSSGVRQYSKYSYRVGSLRQSSGP